MAHTLDENYRLLPMAQAARSGFPAFDLSEQQALDVRVGRKIEVELAGITALFDPDGTFLALYEPAGGPTESMARAVAVFVG